MEGTPTQEMAAIEVNRNTNAIVDVFHAFAWTENPDTFARRHVHGINMNVVKYDSFPNEKIMIDVFKIWVNCKKNVSVIYANDAVRERMVIGFTIQNFNLLPWAKRKDSPAHQIAIRHKELMIPVLGRRCSLAAHSSFISPPSSSNPDTRAAKAKHGFHCALADVMELYYESIMRC